MTAGLARFNENMHPYECDGPGKCSHCDKRKRPGHDPESCELCAGIRPPYPFCYGWPTKADCARRGYCARTPYACDH